MHSMPGCDHRRCGVTSLVFDEAEQLWDVMIDMNPRYRLYRIN